MPLTTLLLDLPNELFPFILQYLRSIDIFKAFSNIQSRRIQALIEPFIRGLDISQESDQCIQTYLPHFVLQNRILALRIQMKHLPLVFDYLSSSEIQSLEVMDCNYDFTSEMVHQLRQNLKKLSLIFVGMDEMSYEDIPLLQFDSQLEYLIIKNCILYYSNTNLDISTRLTYFSVELEGIHPLFLFIQHLPNLQELKVRIFSQECFSQNTPNINGVKPCRTLRAITFTGWMKCYDHLESFFTVFGSTIEYVFLDIRLMFLIVDGTRIERNLLEKMPRLVSFNLNIFSTFSEDDPIKIETFRSPIWDRLNPVVYWYDIHAQQHTLFTLPYKSDRFEHLSNDFLSTCASNRPISLRFNRVQTLSLISTTPLNLETFLWIEKVFPNLTTVELEEEDIHPLIEDDEETREGLLSINEDLLLNTSLQIRSVTRFCITDQYKRMDYKTFSRFLRLFPNLVDLELYIDLSFLHDLLKHKNEDELVEIALARVQQLKIISQDQTDRSINAEIHSLFSEAKLLL